MDSGDSREGRIKQFPRPHNLRSLRHFVGIVGFCTRFIPNYSEKAAPLRRLKQGVKCEWVDLQQASFKYLNGQCEVPVLQMPDFAKPFVLVTSRFQRRSIRG